jgi:DNA-binding NtrC family response regulator
MKNYTLLIVDDEHSVRTSLSKWFIEDGYTTEVAENGTEAIKKLQEHHFDLALVDIKMPGMDGITLQKKIREVASQTIVIIMTAYASVDTAIEALKLGAYDYVTKPFDPDDLSRLVKNALKQKDLTEENIQLKEKITELNLFSEIIGESEEIKRVLGLVQMVAETDSTVLIRGESGTGKELIARAIHCQSKQRFFPIVAVNCGSIPETLLESELFGHEKGAFTGAQFRRKGKLELANNGTLFLDEIGDITAKMQVDLLRVLESKSFTRLGGTEEIQVEFRLICATNKNLEKLVEQEKFREDLYYRINVFSMNLPPLRERRADILLLARHFIEKYARAMSKPIKAIAPDAETCLISYPWPGNVRELENAIERAMVVGKKTTIQIEDLPFQDENRLVPTYSSALTLEDIEREHIQRILKENSGNVSRAANLLGIDRVTLYSKIKKYGILR